MKTGIELITSERVKLKEYNRDFILQQPEGELVSAVIFMLTNDRSWFPKSWTYGQFEKLKEIPIGIKSLKIAGVLIAAEIDRRLEAGEDPDEIIADDLPF